MKAITLLQPWASLVVMGYKTVETRSWTTAYRGRLLIHAGKGKGGRLLCERPSIRPHIPDFGALPFGAIIGEAELFDIVRVPADENMDRKSLEENAFGPAAVRYSWLLRNAVLYDEPIPATGRLGLWEY